jgi:hypothetical protein
MMKGFGKGGFTVKELVAASVVTGIMIALFVPLVTKFIDSTRRTKGANCIQQIAKAYFLYCNDDVNGQNINLAEDKLTGKEWALVLARKDFLNDPNVYIFPGDAGASKVVKKTILNETKGDNDAWEGGNDIEFSVYLINNIPIDAPPATTPIAFSRGIPKIKNDPEGKIAKWPREGVYGDQGGYIAFLDGHIEWFADLGTMTDGEGKLKTWGSRGTTNDIRRAIPATATILSASGNRASHGTEMVE